MRGRIQPEDLVAVELHIRAHRRHLERASIEAAASILLADAAISDLAVELRTGPPVNAWTRALISDQLRTAMCAHQAALLRVQEIEAISRGMGVQK